MAEKGASVIRASAKAATEKAQEEPELTRLCRTRQWNAALTRLAVSPEEVFARYKHQGTALAVSCRYSAPPHVVQALLNTSGGIIEADRRSWIHRRDALRRCNCAPGVQQPVTSSSSSSSSPVSDVVIDPLPARQNPMHLNAGVLGTPLHEAIGNEENDPEVIRVIIQADIEGSAAAAKFKAESSRNMNPCAQCGGLKENFRAENDSTQQDPVPPVACAAQDVDGQIPLHLMVRRVFKACPRPKNKTTSQENTHDSEQDNLTSLEDFQMETSVHDVIEDHEEEENGEDQLLTVLRYLVKAYPQGCAFSDKSEYEETPLILALKSSVYASYAKESEDGDDSFGGFGGIGPAGGSNGDPLSLDDGSRIFESMLEKRVYAAVKIMVDAYPEAARYVANSRYTVLHSALFHGRYAPTLRLLLDAAAMRKNSVASGASSAFAAASPSAMTPSSSDDVLSELCLNANSIHREVPLHFAAMRMESLPVISMLCKAGPAAVHCRDSLGRSPLRWLWVRHVCSSLDKKEGPLNFLHMRHIEKTYLDLAAVRLGVVTSVLQNLREKIDRGTSESAFHTGFESFLDLWEGQKFSPHERDKTRTFFDSFKDHKIALFWTKMQQLLRAVAVSTKCGSGKDGLGSTTILHVAASNSCCPRSVVRIIMSVHPQFLRMRDQSGRLPLHCAAKRAVCGWRPFSPRFGRRAPKRGGKRDIVMVDSLMDLVVVEYPEAARIYDGNGRLPLHWAIDTYQASPEDDEHLVGTEGTDPMDHFSPLLQSFPESVERKDGMTKLYPFMQAAVASGHNECSEDIADEKTGACFLKSQNQSVARNVGNAKKQHPEEVIQTRQLTVIYGLLRVCPSLVNTALGISEEVNTRVSAGCPHQKRSMDPDHTGKKRARLS